MIAYIVIQQIVVISKKKKAAVMIVSQCQFHLNLIQVDEAAAAAATVSVIFCSKKLLADEFLEIKN